MTQVSKKDELLLFGKWGLKVEVRDHGLERYISLSPRHVLHTMGRHEHHGFHKSRLNIVERLINNLMRPGKNAGKKIRAISFAKNAFEIIRLRTGQNPLQVLVQAVENSAPCEDTTRIRYGGIAYHQAVDISPQRRVDLALRFITEGARKTAFNNPRPFEECLAEEIIIAANKDSGSYAVQKRNEMERIAMHAR
ncbi:MAG: 30S ribosomal protein S7 [Candidatus Bathyarchaeota archaeon]|nr:30S ribosomal protein S7 [Candidatus Bathyarchaeota archaeon]